MQDIEDEQISPIIQIFERLTFERGHEVQDQVTAIIELFSLSDVTLDMLDTLIDCIKIIFVNQHTNKNIRILDFIITLTHVTHISYTSNKNLALVFDTLIDIFSQAMIAFDSQIRCTTFRLLNKLQTFIDLSRSPYIPAQFEQYLLELLRNETTFLVLDETIPLAAKFQHKNHRFIDAFLDRINSSKWTTYLDRRRQIILLLEYSSSSLHFLLSTIENDNDLSQLAFESLLADERGFTLDTIGRQGRLTIFKIASTSHDLSRLIFTRWISQSGHELVHLLQLCEISTLNENKKNNDRFIIETCLRYFLKDNHIRRIVLNNTKIAIGGNKGGILSSNISNYIEHLFIWRILCELINEEDDDTNIHPDFHEFISYLYRIIKSSVNEKLSITKEFIICQYVSILSTFDMLDIYRRKCVEAMSRCILVHYGQYEPIIKQAHQLIHHIYPSNDTINERYQLIIYTLNDIIQRCQNVQLEKLIFIQCMTIARVFIEQEKHFDLNYANFKQLIDSLIKSGLSHNEFDSQTQTLSTLGSLMCHSQQAATEYVKQIFHIINKVENISLKCQSLSIFIDILLVHGINILTTTINLDNLTPSQFLTEYFLNLFHEQNMEIKTIIVFGVMKLFLSSRLEPTIILLRIILDYRFTNDHRSINQQERNQITSFFYFFSHLSNSNVLLMEELTFDLITHCLPFISNNSTIAYKSILTESMSYFCIELLSLLTLPTEEYSHYNLAKNLLESIHNSTNNSTICIIKSYLNTIKHLQFQYMNKQQLNIILQLIIQLRQYPNLPMIITNSIKSIHDQIQSSLKLIGKLTNGNNDDDKRSRSPSQSSPISVKRLALSFDPPITSSPAILHDRTNQMTNNNMNQSTQKGIKRKLTTHQYTTLDFENDPDNYF
ncbi:unnamed protein product [Adineta steineri]|uniref:Nuclear condensin complex subunit 3 C-terminal domain-containing protein n=1 Tax=Adineta steineri TaxID=433720 RepID=A0A818UN73_9BILA|nr:unnamed protein product [Adineta steineri]CAF3703063.1 unnamed protein product [Adineta steineri]